MRVMCNRAVSACKRKNMVKRSREQAESLRKSGRKSHLIMCDVMIFPTSEPDKSYQKMTLHLACSKPEHMVPRLEIPCFERLSFSVRNV